MSIEIIDHNKGSSKKYDNLDDDIEKNKGEKIDEKLLEKGKGGAHLNTNHGEVEQENNYARMIEISEKIQHVILKPQFREQIHFYSWSTYI